jgi:hypothetical protein
LRNSGMGLGPVGESKVSSGTKAVEGAGAGGGEVENAVGAVGAVDDEVLRPVRLSHLDA